MRTLAITLVTAFVFLLGLQLPAASRGRHSEERGASQAVVAGFIGCWVSAPAESNSTVLLRTGETLGVVGISTGGDLVEAVGLSEECSDLIPRLAEQVPHRICEIGNSSQAVFDPHVEGITFVCVGPADAVISAVGKMAKAVIRLGQP
jgi:hypothetical protein